MVMGAPVAGVCDHFTVNVLMGLEGAGFCKVGEGGSFVDNGALAIGGRLPTNTAGGFLSFSHAGMCGIFTLIEVVESDSESDIRKRKDVSGVM